jgi:dTMP kinase
MHFIVLEGCDRFGKSAQVKLLVEFLVKCGFKARAFAFPDYGSATGKIIHDHLHGKIAVGHLTKDTHVCHCDPLVFQCVQTVDKYAAAGRILQALRDGVIVVCGRWWQSAYVYGSDDGLDEGWLHDAHECLPRADLNILLDCSPEEAASRTTVAGDRYERDLPKQRRLRDRYLGLWKSMAVGQPGWMVVPAWGAIEQVHAGIVAAVRSSLVKLDGLGQGI